MNLQEFANAFKAEILDAGRQNDLGVLGGIPNFFDNAHHYALGECAIIDQWWNGGNLLHDLGIGNQAGNKDNWVIDDATVNDPHHAEIGRKLGIIFNLGWNNFIARTNPTFAHMPGGGAVVSKDIVVNNPADGAMIRGFVNILNYGSMLNVPARNAWCIAMGGPGVAPRRQALDGTGANARDNIIMFAWFALTQTGGGMIPDINLNAANARALWDNNWESGDILEDAGDILVIHPITGANVNGFANINNLGNKNALVHTRATWWAAMAAAAAPGPRNVVLDGTGATAGDNLIMDAWFALTNAGAGPIANRNLTPEQARALYSNNWEHGDIQNNGGRIRVVHPITGANVNGFANINNLGNKNALAAGGGGGGADAAFLAAFRGAGGNANALVGDAANHITDANVAHFQKHSPDGTQHLTGAQAGAAYNNGWRNPAEIQIINGGQLQVNTGTGWANYDFTAGTRNAYIATNNPDPVPTPKFDQTKIQAAINNIQSQMNSKNPPVTDSELNNELGVNDWKEDYIKKSEDEPNLKVRENTAIAAINKLRERNPEEDRLNSLREAAIKAVNDHWTDKAGSATGKINNQDKSEVLKSTWEQGIRGKADETSINAERDRLIALINSEKDKEVVYSPYHYYNDDESGESKPTDDGVTKKSAKMTDEITKESPTIPMTRGDEETPDKIIEEIKENIDNKYIPNGMVEKIIGATESTFNDNEQENVDKIREVKEVLTIVERCLKKEKYEEKDALLLEQLKSYQGSDSFACQVVNKNGEKISEAISHLENLKMNQESSSVRAANKSWWAEKSTGAKVAIVVLPILGVILIGGVFAKSKGKDTKSEE